MPRVISVLLSITFACGVVIAVAHVVNTRFVAPTYDVVANLIAFGCAGAASLLLRHWMPAVLSAVAFLSWLVLAHRTIRSLRPPAGSSSILTTLPRAGASVGDAGR
jgi:hypothetical protein